ncbi:MAG: crossover junction endodeoxyribonuclease RuvC [Waddliaceae bacterium]|nr:crossover junction endodeoxyribonuclease RuvC [Waddliaceae bacterium]
MIVLGIDPGTRVTGYGLIEIRSGQPHTIDFGCIRPPRGASLSECYTIIFDAVVELIAIHQPDSLSIETQYVQKNPASAMKIGMVRGVVTVAATKAGIPVYEYSPTRAKKAVVGTGSASKEQVQHMMKTLLRLADIPKPADAADALALALCHIQSVQSKLNYGQIL